MKAITSRPGTIRLFAILFFAQALIVYIDGLHDLDRVVLDLASRLPDVNFDHDIAIVILSARLSIALIPIALIWFLRANFARWFVVVVTLGRLISLPDAIALVKSERAISPYWLASNLLAFLAVALLFAPSARPWFRREDNDAAAFE